MLWTLAVILMLMWLLGMITSYTMGGVIHILLVVAIVVEKAGMASGSSWGHRLPPSAKRTATTTKDPATAARRLSGTSLGDGSEPGSRYKNRHGDVTAHGGREAAR